MVGDEYDMCLLVTDIIKLPKCEMHSTQRNGLTIVQGVDVGLICLINSSLIVMFHLPGLNIGLSTLEIGMRY